jgi:spermidine synthase
VLGCATLRGVSGARVLIGGLGMGYTVRAALRKVGEDAHVDVAEFASCIVRWNRGPLAPLAGAPLSDPRVHVIEQDVHHVIDDADARYDAILLDVDNGPAALSAPLNARLYDVAGVKRALRALRPGGVLAVWSTSDSPTFTERLNQAGFTTRLERPTARLGGGARHVIWVAVKPA